MHCPQCGSENANTFNFCQKCGARLPVSTTPAQPAPEIRRVSQAATQTTDPVVQAVWIGMVGSALSGVLILLGWFTPWFGLSSLARQLSSVLGYSFSNGFLGMGSGVGNGLQLTLFGFTASFAAFSLDAPLFGLLALLIPAVMIAVVIVGIILIRLAIALYELRPVSAADKAAKVLPIRARLNTLRGQSSFLFVLLAVIFVVAAAIPYGTAMLGRGFFLCGFGAICGFVSAFLAQSSIKTVTNP